MMIQIEFARDGQQELIHIGELVSGEGKYSCPNCGVKLIPKLGKINRRHFSHVANSCLGPSLGYQIPDRYIPKGLDVVGYHRWYYANLQAYWELLQTKVEKVCEFNEAGGKTVDTAIEFLEKVTVPRGGKLPKNRALNREALEVLISYCEGSETDFWKVYAAFGRVRFSRVKKYEQVECRWTTHKWGQAQNIVRCSVITPGDAWEYYGVNEASDEKIKKEHAVVPEELVPCLKYLWEGMNFKGKLEKWKAKMLKIEPVLNRATALDEMKLYYLEITLKENRKIYKVGITGRVIEERIREIRGNLSELGVVAIEVVVCLQGMGPIESWYKREHGAHQFDLKNFKEYFTIDHREEFQKLESELLWDKTEKIN